MVGACIKIGCIPRNYANLKSGLNIHKQLVSEIFLVAIITFMNIHVLCSLKCHPIA